MSIAPSILALPWHVFREFNVISVINRDLCVKEACCSCEIHVTWLWMLTQVTAGISPPNKDGKSGRSSFVVLPSTQYCRWGTQTFKTSPPVVYKSVTQRQCAVGWYNLFSYTCMSSGFAEESVWSSEENQWGRWTCRKPLDDSPPRGSGEHVVPPLWLPDTLLLFLDSAWDDDSGALHSAGGGTAGTRLLTPARPVPPEGTERHQDNEIIRLL